MSDHCEEQEMEAEALTAIFDECFEIVQSTQPFQWAINLWPEQHSPEENHVGVQLKADIPLDYPESSLPKLSIEILKGLTPDHQEELVQMANEEAEANQGLPSIFAVCERMREWLLENNVKGMDDQSMYAQMIRREQEKKKEEEKAQQTFETQKMVEEMTEAEAEELAVRKRRAEGTPVNLETFQAWKTKFEIEMKEQRKREEEEAAAETGKKKKEKVVDKSGRITGFLQFSDGTGAFNLEDFETAAENAQRDEEEDDDDDEDIAENVNEDLFDVDDDDLEDLDDLDFDSDDDDDDDDEEEPDI